MTIQLISVQINWIAIRNNPDGTKLLTYPEVGCPFKWRGPQGFIQFSFRHFLFTNFTWNSQQKNLKIRSIFANFTSWLGLNFVYWLVFNRFKWGLPLIPGVDWVGGRGEVGGRWEGRAPLTLLGRHGLPNGGGGGGRGLARLLCLTLHLLHNSNSSMCELIMDLFHFFFLIIVAYKHRGPFSIACLP